MGPSIGFHRRDARHLRTVLRPAAAGLRHQARLRPVRAGHEERPALGHLPRPAGGRQLHAGRVEPRQTGRVGAALAGVGERRRAGPRRHPSRGRRPHRRDRAPGHRVPGQRQGDARRRRRPRSPARRRSDRRRPTTRARLARVAGHPSRGRLRPRFRPAHRRGDWTPLPAETGGLVNISRRYGLPEGRSLVWLRTSIRAAAKARSGPPSAGTTRSGSSSTAGRSMPT